MKTVAVVPIKLNSQRVKNKNILPVGGHPLCWHIFNTLLHTKGINEIYCYCSDEAVRKYIPASGVTFLKRDPALDGQLVKAFDIYEHFVADVDADIYIICHTTSPFIKTESIARGLNAIKEKDYDSAFSVKRMQTFAWYQGQPINYDINDVPWTQDLEPVFVETSAFFMFRKDVFAKHHRRIGFKPYICETDNIESVDIDEPDDYELATKIAEWPKLSTATAMSSMKQLGNE